MPAQFLSVFTNENSDIPSLPSNQLAKIHNIDFSTRGIECIFEKLYSSKSADPDNIPTCILKSCASEIAPILQITYTQSFNEGTLRSEPILYQCLRKGIDEVL